MILVDSSAWVEFLRKTGGPAHLFLREALRGAADLACTDVVLMEILAGASGARERDSLRRLLFGLRFFSVQGPADYEAAAEVHRRCRQAGETPRQLVDCLISVVAMRNELELLCVDSDFEVIARHTSLRLALAP